MPRGGGGVRTQAAILAAFLIGCAASAGALAVTGWAQPNGSVGIAAHFTAMNQANSGQAVLMLNHDGPVTLQAAEAGAGDAVLTSPSSDILATAYKLTGAALGSSADADWVSASEFVHPSRSYAVEGAGLSEITLSVRGASAAGRANDAGVYNASVILTVSW